MLPSKSVPPHAIKATLRMTPGDTEDVANPDTEFTWTDGGEDDEGRPVLDLQGDEWWRLLVGFEVRADSATLQSVLPPRASAADDTQMLLSIQCPSTKVRRSILMTQDEGGVPKWRADVDLERRDVRSRVIVRAMLCRKNDDLSGVSTDTATRKNSLIAFGGPVVLMVDHVTRGVQSLVEFRSADFRASALEALKGHPRNLYYLDIRGSGPIVWVNSGHRRFHSVFREEGSTGYGAALRDLTRLWLGESVWTQLFHAALGELDALDRDPDPTLPDDWRGQCLRVFLERLFPDEATTQDQLRLALEMRESQDSSSVLVSMASAVAQDIVRARDLFDSAVRLAENVATREEDN